MAACHTAGIAVKMITGDHAETARAVASRDQSAGARSEPVVTGAELEASAATRAARRLDPVDVFARVSAEQKLRIVGALQARGTSWR